MAYVFPTPLTHATIVRKEARFVATVKIAGREERCFLPAPVNIGDFVLEDIPCLVMKNPPGRKTTWTVKAISLDDSKTWIGVDLNFSNRLFEHFAAEGKLLPLLGSYSTLAREKTLGSSKLDFKVDDLWVEIKTPVDTLHKLYGPNIKLRKNHAAIVNHSTDPSQVERKEVLNPGRMEKQVRDMMIALRKKERAALLTVHQYVPDTVKPYRQMGANTTLKETLDKAYGLGLESWKLDLEYTPEAIYFSELSAARISR